MPTYQSFRQARENLVALWNDVEHAREAAIIRRRGHEDMALLPASELRGLQETVYLLRSPRNAERLHAALEQSRRGPKPQGPSTNSTER